MIQEYYILFNFLNPLNPLLMNLTLSLKKVYILFNLFYKEMLLLLTIYIFMLI